MTERKWLTDEEERAEDVKRQQKWLDEHGCKHIGEKRIMRNGAVVECIDVFWAFADYWGRDRPYVRLKIITGLLKGTVIERSYATMASYPLREAVEEE